MKPWNKKLDRRDLLEYASNELQSALFGCKAAKSFLKGTGVDTSPLDDISEYIEKYKNRIDSEQITVLKNE